MRLPVLVFIMAFSISGAALAQTDPALAAWDQCVGRNLQDYARMFGRSSIVPRGYIKRALDDCYDAEVAYQKAHPQLMPVMVTREREKLSVKWTAAYGTQ